MNQPDSTSTTNFIAVGKEKSMVVALILTFLFGPLGLLYATVPGALILLVLTIVIGFFTLGIGFIVGWLASMIWAVISVNSNNSKIKRTLGQ